MELGEVAGEVLDIFRQTHRRPGARMSFTSLEKRLGSEPVLFATLSELSDAGYMTTPDVETVELTAKGFDHIQRGNYQDATRKA